MSPTIERSYNRFSVKQAILTNSAPSNGAPGTNPVFNFRGFASGEIYVPTGSGITALAWYGSPISDLGDLMYVGEVQNWYPLYDKSNVAVLPTTVTAGRGYPFPLEAFAVGALIIVITGAPTAAVEISLKG